MKPQTLATAFAAALNRGAETPRPTDTAAARPDPDLTADLRLLNALRNSATSRDQIVQRRIGMLAGAFAAD